MSPRREGKFGRLFHLPALVLTAEQVALITDLMREQVVDPATPGGGWNTEPTPTLDNAAIPAGYTYLGQFIDHDITFDPVSSLDRQEDPDALHNFRTPRLDLDSVYGAGPQDQPYLYDVDDALLLVEANSFQQRDLPRNGPGRALVGDPRNDENMIVSQLHLVFLDAHNRLVRELREGMYPAARRSERDESVFQEAQRLLRWHYQYVVATDFLWRTCGGIAAVLLGHEAAGGASPSWEGRLRYGPPDGGRLRYTPRNNPYMPVEFSVAAYRFGHSQPRPGYQLNGGVNAALFVEDPQGATDSRHLGGFRPLLAGWGIEWERFFGDTGGPELQLSRKIDTQITEPLFFLGAPPPDADQRAVRQRQLPWRNLMRGLSQGLPSGEAVALELGVAPIEVAELKQAGVAQTPLWYYVLAEARDQQGGARLGEVGGRIVAEVLLGLLKHDRTSFLREEPGWKPFLGPNASTAQYGMAELVGYAVGGT